MIRLTGRRVCKTCGASFHVVNIPPKKEGICDVCGAELVQRADDNEETAANRIEVYNNETKPLADFYEKAGSLARIDGAAALESVFNAIVEVVGE
jgi:adenylate kinase